eukprot:1195809-Prorocentrum_minimum.AAC.1
MSQTRGFHSPRYRGAHLARLEAVDAGEDVDGVGAEDGEEKHVDVVEHAQVDHVALPVLRQRHGDQVAPAGRKQHLLKRLGEGDVRRARIRHQQRHGGHHRQNQLAAPTQHEPIA